MVYIDFTENEIKAQALESFTPAFESWFTTHWLCDPEPVKFSVPLFPYLEKVNSNSAALTGLL